jgi:methyl-accepting chemotaxis protein
MSTTAQAPGRFSFADLGVRTKILAAVAVAALVALVIGVVGLTTSSRSSTAAQGLYGNVDATGAVGEVRAAMLQARLNLANHAISTDEATIARYEATLAQDLQAVDAAVATYIATGPAGDPALVREMQGDWQNYQAIVREKQIPAGRANDLDAWQATRDREITPMMTELFDDLTQLDAAEEQEADASAKTARDDYENSRTIAIVLLVVGLLLALALGWLVARGIVRSLGRVRSVCDGLADGDLTHTAGLTSADEPGRMARALDTAVLRLRETVKTIDGSASSLSSAAEEMSGVAVQIAASAEETSVQAQAVSTASEEISRSVDTVSAGGG